MVIYLFGVLHRFQHCTGHITTGSWKGRGNQYTQFARVLYCKLPTNGKQLPAFPLEAITGIEPWPQRWEGESVTTLPLWPPHGMLSTLVCKNYTLFKHTLITNTKPIRYTLTRALREYRLSLRYIIHVITNW